MISHVSLGTDDLERACAFYDAVLAPLGYRRLVTYDDVAAAYPDLWIGRPLDRSQPASPGNGVHVAFNAKSPAEVDAFYQAALAAGASDDGAPGPRPLYGEAYYGCFVRDPDGHKIEAVVITEDAG